MSGAERRAGPTSASQAKGTSEPRSASLQPLAAWLVVVAGLAAYGWWATRLAQFTWPARLAFGVPGAAVLLVAFSNRPKRLSIKETCARAAEYLSTALREPGSRIYGGAIWVGLVCFVVAWQLYSFISAEHHRLPTVTHYIFGVTSSHLGEVIAFVAWMASGYYLARR